MGLRVLYIAEIVGKAGIWCVKNALPSVKAAERPDVIIANADGATGSFGLGRQHAGYLRKLGIDIITGGDSIYYKKDLVEAMETLPGVIRPANYPAESPGRGWRFVNVSGRKVAVVSMLGRALFSRVHAENPFTAIDSLGERLRAETPFVIVDFHAAATAEKQAFFHHVDGKVSACVGSHGRVQTADECVLPKGTGCVTDAGRTGSMDSVGGMDGEPKIREYLTGIPEWSRDAWARPMLQGVVIDLDASGKTERIKRLQVPCVNPGAGEGEHAGESENTGD